MKKHFVGARLKWKKIKETKQIWPLLQDPLWPGVVVPVRVPSMNHIDLFKIIRIQSDRVQLLPSPPKKNKDKLWRNNYPKNVNMIIQWTWFPNLLA